MSLDHAEEGGEDRRHDHFPIPHDVDAVPYLAVGNGYDGEPALGHLLPHIGEEHEGNAFLLPRQLFRAVYVVHLGTDEGREVPVAKCCRMMTLAVEPSD